MIHLLERPQFILLLILIKSHHEYTYICVYFPHLRDNLVLTKSGPAEFRFRLAGVQLSDRGFYWCDITAWTKQQPGQTWTRVTSAESNKIRIDFQENGG